MYGDSPSQVAIHSDNALGTYTVRWYVHGRVIRTWSYHLAGEGV